MKVMTSPSTISPLTMQRLAFIQMMHQRGNEQAEQADPMRVMCILTFHDAVELFLVLAGDHLRANINPTLTFTGYWAEIKSKVSVQLTSKAAMERLNRRRVDFKHHGNMPSTSSVDRARAEVATFFEDNTPIVFGIDYDAIDMADLISQTTTRNLVRKAAAEEAKGDRTEAMALLSDAFDDLFRQHAGGYPPSPFSFGPEIMFPLREMDIERTLVNQRGSVSRLSAQISEVIEIASATQAALRVMSLGVDYHRYLRFRQLAPHVSYDINRNRSVVALQDYAPTAEHLRFCQEFVITVALRLEEIGAHIAPPPWAKKPGF